MKSLALPSFWDAYRKLDPSVRVRIKKAYELWLNDPFHPSLRFKCINQPENIWAVRVSRGYRVVGVLDGDTVTWFWAGSHDDYERFFG
jgi:mRNA-degrading endonuclease RelE of RelBE toxin-antitoxin system